MTYIARKTKNNGIIVDTAFNNPDDAEKFAAMINGTVFIINGNNITPFTK